MKHLLSRALEKLDNSVSRSELGDVVRKSEMQLEILKTREGDPGRDPDDEARLEKRERRPSRAHAGETRGDEPHTHGFANRLCSRGGSHQGQGPFMKNITTILCLFALGACAARGPRPPRVGIAPISENFNQVEASADKLDALANTMEERGQ